MVVGEGDPFVMKRIILNMPDETDPGFDAPTGFDLDFDTNAFERHARTSVKKGSYWLASDIAAMLGYKDLASLRGAINKAQQASLSLGIPVDENFRRYDNNDWAVTRFGCYLIAMNGNVRKPEVAAAQVYFAVMAEGFRQYVEQAENMDRILLRDEISDHEKMLSTTAKGAGVERYPFFQSEGYRGLYNMSMTELRKKKNVPEGRSPLDFMRRTELAANLFRITQTEEKIRKEQLQGQKELEQAAFVVGQTVRTTMEHLSQTKPEDIPAGEDIKTVKSALKKTHKKLQQPSLKSLK